MHQFNIQLAVGPLAQSCIHPVVRPIGQLIGLQLVVMSTGQPGVQPLGQAGGQMRGHTS